MTVDRWLGRMVLTVVLVAPSLGWAAGGLDPSFGDGGTVTKFIQGGASAAAVVREPSGNIVVAGEAGQNFVVARFLPSGLHDPSFTSKGFVRTSFGSSTSQAFALVRLTDGRLVAGGSTFSTSGDGEFALARYDTGGTLDPTFGSGGQVVTHVSGDHDTIRGLALQSDGKLIACGFTIPLNGGTNTGRLARYDESGNLDPTFGVGGIVSTPAFERGIAALALQSDGRIVVVGSTANELAVARYTTTGTLDSSFGSGGITTTNVPGVLRTVGAAIAIDANGRIIAGGAVAQGSPLQAVVVRYLDDGTPDPSFDGDGIVTLGDEQGNEIRAVAVQPDGKIVVAGTGREYYYYPVYFYAVFEVARLDPDGTLDPSFGGIRTTFFDTGTSGNAVMLQADDNIVVAGTTSNSLALARYIGTAVCGDGGLDPGEACDDGNVAAGDCCSPTCTLDASGTACSDGNPCTDDLQCDGAGTCVTANNSAPCDDGAFCNGADTCASGSCSVHSGDPCAGGAECQTSCDELTESCFNQASVPCTSDGNFCTNDHCDGAGQCVHSFNSAPCPDDGNACTDDHCVEGACAHPPNSAACDDGDPCTRFDHCSNAACASGYGCFTCERCNAGVGCEVFEQPACKSSVKPLAGLLRLKYIPGFSQSAFQWQWKAGEATTVAEFGDPVTSDDYEICMFDDEAASTPEIIMAVPVPAGGTCNSKPCWTATSKGPKYKNRGTGVLGITTRAGADGAAAIKLKGKNIGFDLRYGVASKPLRLQLRTESGQCWESTFSAAHVLKSSDFEYKAKSD